MRGFVRDLRAEFLKMRRTFLYPMHLIVPVVGSIVFLLYYSYAAVSYTHLTLPTKRIV